MSGREQKFRKLTVWHKSLDFIEDIYKLTQEFPNHELYGLTSQLRRAALSVAMNIAEGSGTGSDREFNRFLNISSAFAGDHGFARGGRRKSSAASARCSPLSQRADESCEAPKRKFRSEAGSYTERDHGFSRGATCS